MYIIRGFSYRRLLFCTLMLYVTAGLYVYFVHAFNLEGRM